MIPSPIRDYLFVKIDASTLDRTAGGVYVPDWQPGDKDAQQAEVVAVPLGLSQAPLPYPGMDGRAYTYSDLRDLPRVGETVYLMPNTFKPEYEYPGHPGVFMVPLGKVIAVAASAEDGGPVVPFQGLLLCHPVYGDDVYENAQGIRERLVHAIDPIDGAQIQEFVAEVDPLPLPFALKVVYAGVPLAGQPDVVKAGDVVIAHKMMFAHHAVRNQDNDPGEGRGRWCWQPRTIFIDGHEYAYIPRQCILAVEEKDKLWFEAPRGQRRSVTREAIRELASKINFKGSASGIYDGAKPYFFNDEWGTMQNTPVKQLTGFTENDFDEIIERVKLLPVNPDWRVHFEKVEGGYLATFSGGIMGQHLFTEEEYKHLNLHGKAD